MMKKELDVGEREAINWGIIGCGDVAEKKSGPAFSTLSGSRLVAVLRRDLAKAQDYARRHGVARAYGSVDELVKDPEVDAVYIATPPSSHAEIAQKVAVAGKPCYVEKPMATTRAEAEAMLAAFQTAGLPLLVAYYRRALPHFSRVKELIESRELGALRQIVYALAGGQMLPGADVSDWRFDPTLSGGGLVWDLGSHALDLLDFWAGPLENVAGQLVNHTRRTLVEETAALTATSATGVSIVAHWNFLSAVKMDRMTLTFDEGCVTCSVFGPPVVEIHQGDGATTENYDLPSAIQAPLIENVLAHLRGKGPALSTGESALRTNVVLDTLSSWKP